MKTIGAIDFNIFHRLFNFPTRGSQYFLIAAQRVAININDLADCQYAIVALIGEQCRVECNYFEA
jgi:hypothetical protein